MSNRQLRSWLFLASITILANSLFAQGIDYQPPLETPMAQFEVSPEIASSAATSNPMLWQQYQVLQTGGYAQSECQTCSGRGSSDYNRCGCNSEVFPWNRGPGDCDQWCVGPKWAVDAGGLFMFRENADWGGVIASVGGATTLVDQFDHGLGGRVFVTGYNDAGYGIQVGYEGINDWNASLAFAPVGTLTRDFQYQSRLNSLEINFISNRPSPWNWFTGFRYLQLDEDFIESRILDKPIPAPADPPAASAPFIDLGFNHLIENRLFGFQFGSRRDAWHWGNQLTVYSYANAGVYCNKLRRDDVELTVATIITGDDLSTPNVNEFSQTTSTAQTSVRRSSTDIAFVGEAGLSANWRLNHCTSVRAGYQILALDGVGQGINEFLTPDLAANSTTLIFHGLQFGLEYRR